MPQDPFADLTPNGRPVTGQRREIPDDPFADLIPSDPFKPVGRAVPRDASQTKATTQNVTGRRNDWPDAIRTLAQGASFKAGDEIEAAVRSGNYKPDPRVIAERILQAAALDATLAVNLRKP